ncbi:MAG TPA: PPC domain-containing DNA-binding protein [Polyangiaceae bacterium]|jgi:predicted DNA-binding protein with PD1-like motif|nr:PPC domain-containing DNA-binding protein [Polyangiaceae bacterium]
MTAHVQRSERSRHLVLRLTAGDALPQALVAALRDEGVSAGWIRAGGLVTDVELRAFDPARGQLGGRRTIAGPVHVLSIESSIGMAGGEPSLSLRAVLARETDRGLETFAGEIASARALALEAMVTAFDDLVLARSADATGVALLEGGGSGGMAPAGGAARGPSAEAGSRATGTASAWSAAASASTTIDRDPPRAAYPGPSGTAGASGTAGTAGHGAPVPLPQRPAKPAPEDQPTPEPGDVVDHFAFGRCEVIKSDGDRLHLRIPKDGRIREIALEMLRVIPLEDESSAGGPRRYKLERRI